MLGVYWLCDGAGLLLGKMSGAAMQKKLGMFLSHLIITYIFTSVGSKFLSVISSTCFFTAITTRLPTVLCKRISEFWTLGLAMAGTLGLFIFCLLYRPPAYLSLPIYTAFQSQNNTYDHRHWKTRDPVRSPLDKPATARLVVGWVTTSESLVLYVFVLLPFFLFLGQ